MKNIVLIWHKGNKKLSSQQSKRNHTKMILIHACHTYLKENSGKQHIVKATFLTRSQVYFLINGEH